jgi:hypothetical protein
MEANGNRCLFSAGKCEHSRARSYVAAQAAFDDPVVDEVGSGQAPPGQSRPPDVIRRLRELGNLLKAELFTYAFSSSQTCW